MRGRHALCLLLTGLSLLTAQARDIRVRDVAGLRAAVETAEPGDRILLRPGVYRFSESLVIADKRDLVIEALRTGSRVQINGGVRIPRRRLRRATGLHRGVRCFDISQLPVTGVLQKGHMHPIGPSWSELYADGAPLRLSSWPDERWMPLDSVVCEGISVRFGRGGAAHPDQPGGVKPSADLSLSDGTDKDGEWPLQTGFGTIYFRSDRPLSWSRPEMGWLSGCFRYGWADELVGIKSIGQDHTLEVRDTTYYGFGFRPGEDFQKWRVLNIPEEIDQAGEYALDLEGGQVDVLLPKGCKSLEFSLLGEPLIRMERCSGVILRGLEFFCSRGDGISVKASEQVSIDRCTLHGLGQIAVSFDAASRACGVSGSSLYDLGAGAVILDGGDRVQIERGDNYVEDCVLHDYNRIDKSNRPAIALKGLGNRISRCEIYHSATVAIMLYGNDQLIEGCDIHEICQDVEDMGAIYNGRDPSSRGNVIRWNYFHDLLARRNIRAVYHDDGACACEVYGNLFNRISSPPVQIGGGSDIVYHDNIFMNLDCAAIKIDGRLKTWGADRLIAHRENIALVDGPAFRAHYPDFSAYLEGDPAEPTGNVLERNVFYKVRWAFEKVVWSDHQYNDILEGSANFVSTMRDNWKTDENPGFKDPADPLAGFTDHPLLLDHIPAFRLDNPLFETRSKD